MEGAHVYQDDKHGMNDHLRENKKKEMFEAK
jgi:hypothetical protein